MPTLKYIILLYFFSNDNNYFKASLTLYNNISAGVIIHKNSTLKELAREVNMFCHCKICIVDRREAQLFAVDKNGKGIVIFFIITWADFTFDLIMTGTL